MAPVARSAEISRSPHAAVSRRTCATRINLRVLTDSGMPVAEARSIVAVAARKHLSVADTCALARSAAMSYRRGTNVWEIVNLTDDVLGPGIGMPTMLVLMDAQGRLAEEGFTDAETRRDLVLLAQEVEVAERRHSTQRRAVDEVRRRIRQLRQRQSAQRLDEHVAQ
jgi:hypothetical protein